MSLGLVRPACSAVARQKAAIVGWQIRAHPYSSTALPTQDVKPEAYISQSSDPLFNLSLEDFLFRNRPAHVPVCLIYRNSPCIVIGRNQNPWRELDVRQMNLVDLPLVRRRSGGGAVYHDLGNTNHSFHIARQDFTRRFHAELVARALNSSPVSLVSDGSTEDLGDSSRGAYVNARNDVCIALRKPTSSSSNNGEAEAPAEKLERKVSGSAYKIISQRAYHHGTMLLHSDLDRLKGSLRPTRGEAMRSKGVESVSSPVVNLSEAFASRRAQLSHESYVESLVREFARTYGGVAARRSNGEHGTEGRKEDIHIMLVEEDDEIGRQGKLRDGWEELKSWEWIWGQTPEFHHTIQLQPFHQQLGQDIRSTGDRLLHLHVKQGRILSADLEGDETRLVAIVRHMVGKRYNILADAPRTTFEKAGKGEELGRKRIEDGLAELGVRESKDGATFGAEEVELAEKFLAWLKGML